jgi:predicted Zn finger-like uncharacterized protein
MSEHEKVVAKCGQCGTSYRIRASVMGRKLKCPKCGGLFTLNPRLTPVPSTGDQTLIGASNPFAAAPPPPIMQSEAPEPKPTDSSIKPVTAPLQSLVDDLHTDAPAPAKTDSTRQAESLLDTSAEPKALDETAGATEDIAPSQTPEDDNQMEHDSALADDARPDAPEIAAKQALASHTVATQEAPPSADSPAIKATGSHFAPEPHRPPLDAAPLPDVRPPTKTPAAFSTPDNTQKNHERFTATQFLLVLLMRLGALTALVLSLELILEFVSRSAVKPWPNYLPSFLIVSVALFGVYHGFKKTWRRANEAGGHDTSLAYVLSRILIATGEVFIIAWLVYGCVDVIANWMGGPNIVNILDAQLQLPFELRRLDAGSFFAASAQALGGAMVCAVISFGGSEILTLMIRSASKDRRRA